MFNLLTKMLHDYIDRKSQSQHIFLSIIYAPKNGPKRLENIFCKVPNAYINDKAKTKIPKIMINMLVPPIPKIFSANPISPVNSFTALLYFSMKYATGQQIITTNHLSINTIKSIYQIYLFFFYSHS